MQKRTRNLILGWLAANALLVGGFVALFLHPDNLFPLHIPRWIDITSTVILALFIALNAGALLLAVLFRMRRNPTARRRPPGPGAS